MDPLSVVLSALLTSTQVTPGTIPASPEQVSPSAEKGVRVALGEPGGIVSSPAPTISVNIRHLGNQLVCMQRSRTQMYATGATGVRSDDDSYWGYFGSTVVMSWCLSNGQAIVVAAGQGSTPQQAVQAFVQGF